GSHSRFGGRACRCTRHKRERPKNSLSGTAGGGLQASPRCLPRVLSIGRTRTLVGFHIGVPAKRLEIVRLPTQPCRGSPRQAAWTGPQRKQKFGERRVNFVFSDQKIVKGK